MTTTNKEKEYVVEHIPVKSILRDDDFNCRGEITMDSVYTLAEDIKNRGLDTPITVMPYSGQGTQYKYKIVAGHRRYTAVRSLRWETIPCYIRADIDDTQAAVINFKENFERKELNILQEAKAIQALLRQDLTPKQIAAVINQGTRWVNIRIGLLRLPDSVKDDAVAGLITPREIEMLTDLLDAGKSQEEILKFARAAADKRKYVSNTTLKILNKMTSTREESVTKVRPKEEIEEIHDVCLEALRVPSLATYALAWVLGTITTKKFLEQIGKECELYQYPFVVPHIYIQSEAEEREKYRIIDQ